MSSRNLKCGVCLNEYSAEFTRQPLCLTVCGHTFCRQCMSTFEVKSIKKICPACRSDWAYVAVNDLPVCFQLIPENPGIDHQDILRDDDVCKRHDLPSAFYCGKCDENVCVKCCASEDHRTCEFVVRTNDVQDLDSKEVSLRLFSLNKNMYKVNKQLYILKRRINDLVKYEHEQKNILRILMELKKSYAKMLALTNHANDSFMNANERDKQTVPNLHGDEVRRSTFCTTNRIADKTGAKTTNQNGGIQIEFQGNVREKFLDKGVWMINQNKTAQEVIQVLETTSFRPGWIFVIVNEDPYWHEPTLIKLLKTITQKRQDFQVILEFHDTMMNPSKPGVDNKLRLQCFQDKNRRCRIRSYEGYLEEEEAMCLTSHPELCETISFTLLINNRRNLNAVYCVLSSGVQVKSPFVLVISKELPLSDLNALPPVNCVVFQLLFQRIHYTQLNWLMNVLSRLNYHNIVREVHLTETSLTESHLDHLLCHLIDTSPFSNMNICVQTDSLDEDGRRRTEQRYKRYSFNISWTFKDNS